MQLLYVTVTALESYVDPVTAIATAASAITPTLAAAAIAAPAITTATAPNTTVAYIALNTSAVATRRHRHRRHRCPVPAYDSIVAWWHSSPRSSPSPNLQSLDTTDTHTPRVARTSMR